MQESLGFYNVGEFSDWPPTEIKIIKGDGNCFFRTISNLLEGTNRLYVCVRLKATEFNRTTEAHMQNTQANLEESNIEQNSVWVTENEAYVSVSLGLA